MSIAPPSSAGPGIPDAQVAEPVPAPPLQQSTRARHDPNPLGCVLAAAGAAAVIVSAFLPAYQSSQPTLLGIQSNTFIQQDDKTGWVLVVLGVAVLVAAYRSYSAHIRVWSVLVLGLLALAAAIRLGTHPPDLYQIGLDGTPNLSNPITSSAGIAVYVLAAGGLLATIGGRVMRESRSASAPSPSQSPSVEKTPATATKRCPDCAETVLAAAQVCKHCRYRFDPVTVLDK